MQFSAGSETVDEAAGTFSIPVTLLGAADSKVTVPFTLSGTAASVVVFSGLTASPLTFGLGQTIEDITGKLLADPGPNQTMTFTLGAPTGGAALGNPSVSSLTINEHPTVQFKTGSETVNEAAGTFSIPVTISGALSGGGTVTVPFELGGTAVSGVAFRGVTTGVLTFGIGQTTQFITGTLLSDPGASQTLTFTLETPAGGAVLGSPSVNTLTIDEPAHGSTPPPTGTTTGSSVPPVFLGEERVYSGKGRHKKLVGFEFLFISALNIGAAQSTGNYRVTQKLGKKGKVLGIKSALYNPSNFSVTISVAGFSTGKAAQVAITGLEGADGAAIPQFESRL